MVIVSRYSRIFSIGSHGITTYNCTTLEITNRWLYEDIINVRAMPQQHEFIITIKKGKDKKPDTMRFSTVHRSHVLSDALKHRHLFAERRMDLFVSFSNKLHQNSVMKRETKIFRLKFSRVYCVIKLWNNKPEIKYILNEYLLINENIEICTIPNDICL